MDNLTYLQSIGVDDVETQQKCLEAMAKYDDNHWWEPDVDPRQCACYQIKEDILLTTFSHFHEAMELLLGRPVYTHEFGLNRQKLIQEAERAWKYQVGATSDTERRERVMEAFQELQDYATRTGKQVIEIRLPQDDEPE